MTRHALRATLAILVVVSLAGCGTRTDRPDAADKSGGATADITEPVAPQATAEPDEGETDHGSVSDVTWDGWDPSYQEARMATPADLAELTSRVQGLNASEWTAILRDDVELAAGAGHVRATIAQGATLHLDPASLGSFVLCVEGDGCVEEELSPTPDEGDVLTPMAVYLIDALRAQRSPGFHLDDETAYAVIDSPAGPLECLVGLRGADLRNLQGARPDTGEGEPPPGTATEDRVCVDQRGLVLLSRVRTTPLLELTGWQPGAPDGFDQHAAPEPAE